MAKDPIHLENRENDGLRLYSPTAGRNSGPISMELSKLLPKNAAVLEIASGTGEQAVATCKARTDITWQPSDPDERSRQSQNAWRNEVHGQMHQPLEIDTMSPKWWGDFGSFDAMFCANMVHIAPWEAALGYADGARQLLREHGQAILYGPFQEGDKTVPSNLKFDENLKARNPLWGVRKLDSVKHMFADRGFNLQARIEMPANNLILVFSRT